MSSVEMPTNRREPEHAVQFYRDVGFLVEMASSYLQQGIAAGEGAIALVRAPRLRALIAHLSVTSHPVLVSMDADVAVARCVRGNAVDERAFEELVGELVARARGDSPTRPIRIYGEMVDILWESGRTDAVVRLEQLWSDACATHGMRRLCAYALAGFTSVEHAHVFDHICRAHSHVTPSERYADMSHSALLRELAHMEQRAAALEGEIARRRLAETATTRLLNMGRALHRATTLEQVAEAALDGATELLGAARAAVLFSNDDGLTHLDAWRGLSMDFRSAMMAATPWPRDTREHELVIVADVERDIGWAAFREPCRRENIRSIIVLPLAYQQRSMGVLALYGEARRELSVAEAELARCIAVQVGQAVALRTYT